MCPCSFALGKGAQARGCLRPQLAAAPSPVQAEQLCVPSPWCCPASGVSGQGIAEMTAPIAVLPTYVSLGLYLVCVSFPCLLPASPVPGCLSICKQRAGPALLQYHDVGGGASVLRPPHHQSSCDGSTRAWCVGSVSSGYHSLEGNRGDPHITPLVLIEADLSLLFPLTCPSLCV